MDLFAALPQDTDDSVVAISRADSWVLRSGAPVPDHFLARPPVTTLVLRGQTFARFSLS